jgi:hypothetical protein
MPIGDCAIREFDEWLHGRFVEFCVCELVNVVKWSMGECREIGMD